MEDGPGTPRLWLVSATAFALAGMVAVVLHEASHAVAGLLSGADGVTLYGYQVTYAEPHPHPVLTALVGPVFSLVIGLVVITTTARAGRGFWRLFWLWLGLVSVENFAGYLVIAPFGHVGDTGSALDRLDAPGWAYLVCFVVGIAMVLALSARFVTQLLRYAGTVADLRQLGVLAWLAGTGFAVVRTLLELVPEASSDVVPTVVAGAVASGIFAPILTPAWRRFTARPEPVVLAVPASGLVATVVLTLVLVLGLSFGLPLG